MTEDNGNRDYVRMKDGPRFDLSEMSWKDSKMLSTVGVRLENARANSDVEAMETIYNELESYFARCVVYVPRSLVVKSAPDEIDWRDPGSYDYLKQRSMAVLQQELAAELESDQEN